MAGNSLLAKIMLPKKPANWTHLTYRHETFGFRIISVALAGYPAKSSWGSYRENQRAPKDPRNADPPKSGLRVSVCCFLPLAPCFAAVWPSAAAAKTFVCFSIRMSSSLVKCLLLTVASVVRSPTMIRVTLLCGRVLSGRALWRLLTKCQRNCSDLARAAPACPGNRSFRLCPRTSICFHGPFEQILGSAPPSSPTICASENLPHSTFFATQRPKGAHADLPPPPGQNDFRNHSIAVLFSKCPGVLTRNSYESPNNNSQKC